jgi:protein required for attachment to host cells
LKFIPERAEHVCTTHRIEENTMNEVTIPTGALVMVGDGRRALFLRNTGTPRHVELLTEQVMEIDNPPTHEQGSDRPGRYMASNGASRGAVEQTDWHQLAEDRFAVEIADTLHRKRNAREFDDLVVIAPPKMLGNLRAAFHPDVATRVVAEFAKDLTSRPVAEVAKLLCL